MTLSDDDDDAPVSTAPVPPLSPETRRKQRVLLAVVIILGIAIVVAFAVLVVGLIFGVPGSSRGPKPWAYTLDVPAGTHVNSMNSEGGRIVLHLTGPAGEDVVLVDAANGKVVGRIHLQPVR